MKRIRRLNGRLERVRLKPARVRLDKPARVRLEALTVGKRVYDLGNPRRKGKLIAVGPEVSEVEWFDLDRGRKFRQYVTNDYLRLAHD